MAAGCHLCLPRSLDLPSQRVPALRAAPAQRQNRGSPGVAARRQRAQTPPAQCRNWLEGSGKREVCGHRLHGAEPAPAVLAAELADLQTVLMGLLDGDEPAELASQRFANLQVAISLIQAGWPVAAELAPAATRAILEAHLAPQQQDGHSPGPAAEGAGSPPAGVWSAPPGDAIATAGLLFAAYHLLAEDSSGPRSPLPQMLRNLPTRDDLRWGRTWHMLAHEASPSFRRRIDQVYRHRLSSEWIRQGAPTLPASKSTGEHAPVRLWVEGTTSTSWATVDYDGTRTTEFTVNQAGPRHLGNEIAAAYASWTNNGRPGVSRHGLTVHADGEHTVWLDSPDHPLIPSTKGRAKISKNP